MSVSNWVHGPHPPIYNQVNDWIFLLPRLDCGSITAGERLQLQQMTNDDGATGAPPQALEFTLEAFSARVDSSVEIHRSLQLLDCLISVSQFETGLTVLAIPLW